MKRAHTITITEFIKPEEDEEAGKRRFLSFLPFDLEQEKLQVKESTSTGFNDRKITVLELRLTKERHTNAFIDFLTENLSGAQKQQLQEQENRLDDDCDYFLRFQKGHLPKFVLTDGGDCIHVRISVAAFPKNRAVALDMMKAILK